MQPLHTPRLILQPFAPSDYPNLYRLYQDPAVTQYTGEVPFASVEAVATAFADYAEQQYKPFSTGRLNVVEKATGAFVGWCGLKTLENGTVDLDFRLLPAFWGKGYATEASMACLRYGFEVLGLAAIVSDALVANKASIRVKEKLGMRPIHQGYFEGQPAMLYQIDRDTYHCLWPEEA